MPEHVLDSVELCTVYLREIVSICWLWVCVPTSITVFRYTKWLYHLTTIRFASTLLIKKIKQFAQRYILSSVNKNILESTVVIIVQLLFNYWAICWEQHTCIIIIVWKQHTQKFTVHWQCYVLWSGATLPEGTWGQWVRPSPSTRGWVFWAGCGRQSHQDCQIEGQERDREEDSGEGYYLASLLHRPWVKEKRRLL